MSHTTRLIAAETSLVVVDVQERLVPKIHHSDRIVANIRFLMDVAALVEVPIVATEQYPKGLGKTVAALAKGLPKTVPDKLGFSCCAVETFVPELFRTHKTRVVLSGIETHVCVLHTALDLLAE